MQRLHSNLPPFCAAEEGLMVGTVYGGDIQSIGTDH